MRLAGGEDPSLKLRFTRRAALLGLGQAGLLGLLGYRLHDLQVVEAERYSGMALGNRLSTHQVAPERGRIFDRFGTLLASNVTSHRAAIIPHLAGNVGEVITRLRDTVEIAPEEEERIVRLAARQNRRLPILVAANLTWEQVARVNLMAPQLPGVHTEVGYARQYFHGRSMGHIVGYVGSPDRITPDDDPVLRMQGMRVGRAGVELGLDRRLRGEGGNIRLEMEGRSRTIRHAGETPSRPGRDVVLTIDLEMQSRVLEMIAHERRAAVVALDVESGEVLVMASQPIFDNTPLADVIGEQAWSALQHAPDDPMINRTIRGLYPPGSTFKMVTALAGLESGEITPAAQISCSGSLEFHGQHYGCWRRSGHGSVNLHRAIKESCDVYFYEVARRVGIDRLAAVARSMGFGQEYDCGLPQQKAGVVPSRDWKIATLERRWFSGETLLAGIGQGYMLANPLQMATMTARIASGRAVSPRLFRHDSIDEAAGRRQPEPLAFRPQYIDAVRRGMYAVVNEGGTGQGVAIDINGMQMAGKTGTSQVAGFSRTRSNDDLPWHQRDHSLFVGYAPYKRPRYAVAAIVEHGGGGARVAGPIVERVMTELLTRDPLSRPAFVAGGSIVPSSARRS
jgi:penicillin-binding protein 2